MNVVVSNANSRMAYCMVRSLARKGHFVAVADHVPRAMSFFSAYASDKFLYPSPYSSPADFLRRIKSWIVQHSVDVLIPIHEETFLIAKYADTLREVVNFAVPEYGAILQVHSKDRLYSCLTNLGILTPRTIPLSTTGDYAGLHDLFLGKALLKPRQGGGNWGIHYLDPAEDFGSQIERYLASSGIEKGRVLIQEHIPISRKYSHVVIYQNGKLVQDFADTHVRDFPLGGGAGCLRVSCDPGPMTQISRSLFDSLNWHGIAEVEYVTHAETGDYYLIEVNPRIWGGLNSAISSGIDIAAILLDIAQDRQIVKNTEYTRGVATRWFWGDMRVFPQYLRKSPSRLKAVMEYMQLMANGTKTDEFYWDDPLPFFVWPAHTLFKMIKFRSMKPVAYDSLGGEWE